MESKAKLFGHPIHQMLIVFPLGLLPVAALADIAALATGNNFWFQMAFYMIAAGILGGLVAAVFGTIDYLAIPAGTRAKRIGFLHGAGNVVVVGLFAVSWWLRYSSVDLAPGNLALILGFSAIGLALVTAWLGGELVDRLGVGVDPGAHLDAPSSLTNEPIASRAGADARRRAFRRRKRLPRGLRAGRVARAVAGGCPAGLRAARGAYPAHPDRGRPG